MNAVVSFGKDFAVIGLGIPEPHPFLSFSQQISPTFDESLGDGYFSAFQILLALITLLFPR